MTKKVGRPKGLPKTGGRQAGTPNKDKPLKQLLATHSLEYFTPSLHADDIPQLRDDKGNLPPWLKGKVLSQYDIDCLTMKAADRAKLEVDILAYHTPKMQSISADMTVQATSRTLAERITRLANGEDIPSGVDE